MRAYRSVLVHWSRAGMTYWAVSDVSEDRLRQFAGLLRSP
jgi:anti-sigma factor RsiW